MKQSQNNGRRPRRRYNNNGGSSSGGGGHRHSNSGSTYVKSHQNSNPRHNMESNGPTGKVKGNARQLFDRYTFLARDSLSAGDFITAENHFQHAEHYFRMSADLPPAFRAQNPESAEAQADAPREETAEPEKHTPQGFEPEQPQRLPSFLYNKANIDESDFDMAASDPGEQS